MKTLSRKKEGNSWKPAILLSCLFACLVLLTSCSKDDPGPSKTELLTGKWNLEEINGMNLSSSFQIEVTFDADGDYEEEINNNGELERYTGEWEWNSDQDEITIDYDQNFSDWELDVETLSTTELELEDGSDTFLFSKD
ncbi:hypothetical protein [Ekhidna sp.]|uniref:hypothetical protein n=1 Tax=Ekhidna sp. TaxID=2608089 RepID=UPI003297035C